MTSKTPSKGYVEAWEVASLTEPDKEYTVSKRADGTYACSCPRWKFHSAPKVDCKHCAYVRGLTDDVPPYRVPERPTVIVSRAGAAKLKASVETARAVAEMARAAVAQMAKAEPDALERFTVRRKFKFTD